MTLAGMAVLDSMAKHCTEATESRLETRICRTWASFDDDGKSDGKKSVADENVVCSLDVSDWDLAKVLHVLSQQAGVNVISLSTSDKKLTVRLADVKLSEMIRHICAITGMASLKTGGTYVIATADQLKTAYPIEWAIANPTKADPLLEIATDLYMCSYVNSSQIVDTLTKLFQDQKLLVIAGPQQQVPTLASADAGSGTGQASTMLAGGGSGGSGGGGGGSSAGASALSGKTILIRGPRLIVDTAMRLARELDRPQPQVSIAVRVDDISNDALKDLGLQWSFSNLSITETKGTGLSVGSFDRSPLGFNAAVTALEQKNVAKLLAEPNISVLDGEKAMILIGSRLNFPQLIGYSNANTPIFDRQEERVGIYLQVSASITSSGEITLSLYPQVSTVSGFLNVNGASYPQISTREAQTTLRVHSGQTIVMGGLMQNEDLVETEKVPFLSEIPILGELFKHRKTTHTKSQVIISITPVVLSQAK
ncbi:MAG: type II secretion system protein GspD [Fimbriimonadales bacterium]